MLVTFQIVRNPLNRPEWLEVICSFLCATQTILALLVFDELTDRPGLLLVFFLVPAWLWAVGGALLCVGHIYAIRKDCIWLRSRVAVVGFGFWFHFAASVLVTALITDSPIPMTLAPVLFVPAVYGGLAWRLARYSV